MNWNKAAVITTVLIVLIPATGRFAWQVIFPPDYLLYYVTPAIVAYDSTAQAIITTNAGSQPQEDVTLYLPSGSLDPENTKIEITSPKQYGSYFRAEPDISINDVTHKGGYKIPLGRLNPGEEVRFAVASKDVTGYRSYTLPISDVRIESSATVAKEADGTPYPDHPDDLHNIYISASPYIFALFASIIALIMLIGLLYDIFFDSHKKQMTRLWRQMDDLQEKIDKERRYQ